MSEKKVIVGIDLGTTNTCIYYKAPNGDYNVAENFDGKRTTPSVVSFTEEGDVIIGSVAKSQMPQIPERTIYGVKRLIGHKKGDEDVDQLFGNAGFRIKFDEKNNPYIEVPGKEKKYRPEEISSIILNEANRIIKNKTGRNIDECIITVPAYFNDLQRRATMQAAELAGINCIKLVNEPTAAAIAFQEKVKYKNGNVLVFDFGGGTLDVSILNVEGNKYTVKAVSGNTSLGGEDIDNILVNEMVKRFKAKYGGSNIEDSPRAMAVLKEKCEEAKCHLSSSFNKRIIIPNLFNGNDLDESITRSNFEYLCTDIIDNLTNPIDIALEDAGLEVDDIDHIILVGGSSAIPFVYEKIKDHFNEKEPLKATDPNESVALGALIVCDKILNNGIKYGDSNYVEKTTVKEYEESVINIIETQPISIGIKYGNRKFKKFIISNKKLPQNADFTFTTTKNDQTRADIEVYQGEEERISLSGRKHIFLGKYTIEGLPKKPAGELVITIKLSVDEGGILSLSALCKENGVVPISTTIKTEDILNDKEKKDAFDELKAINERKDLTKQYENLLNEFSNAISNASAKGKDVKEFEDSFNEIKDDKFKNTDEIKEAIKEIEGKIKKINGL